MGQRLRHVLGNSDEDAWHRTSKEDAVSGTLEEDARLGTFW